MKFQIYSVILILAFSISSVWTQEEAQPIVEEVQPIVEEAAAVVQDEPTNDQVQDVVELVGNPEEVIVTDDAPEISLEYTDFRMSIDHALGSLSVRIADWQASIFDHIQATLTPLYGQWNEFKISIRSKLINEETIVLTTDVGHSKGVLQQQVSLLKEALTTGNTIEDELVTMEGQINTWIEEINANVDGSRSEERKASLSTALETLESSARNRIKESKSSIQKIFTNHYYDIDNDRLRLNGQMDAMNMETKASLVQLTAEVQVANNSISNRLEQEANSLQELIDSTVVQLRRYLDTNLLSTDRDKIVNHLDERSLQLDESLNIAHSENYLALDNYIKNLLSEIQNNIYTTENEVGTMKWKLETLTSTNKARASRLSIQTYKTLEPVESLLASVTKRLQKTIENIKF